MSFPDPTLRVKCPISAELLMMSWSTHDEGTHVILARTEKGLQRTWDRVRKREREFPDVGLVARVQIGAPPEEIQDAARLQKEELFRSEFQSWVLMSVHQASRVGVSPPPFFQKCGCGDGCDRCEGFEYILRDGYDWETMYERGKEAWYDWARRKEEGFYLPKDAIKLPLQELSIAFCDFGHHSRGIALESVVDLTPLTRPILFFFHVLEQLPVPTWITEARDRLKKEEEQRREDFRNRWVHSNTRERREAEDSMKTLTDLLKN